MNLKQDLKKIGYAALLMLMGILLLNRSQLCFFNGNHNPEAAIGYFLSESNHLCGSFSDEDHSCPADSMEDEDEDDDENGFESSVVRSFQGLVNSFSFTFHHDRLFCDPLAELVSPPPKF
jgi:hypothetical protein